MPQATVPRSSATVLGSARIAAGERITVAPSAHPGAHDDSLVVEDLTILTSCLACLECHSRDPSEALLGLDSLRVG